MDFTNPCENFSCPCSKYSNDNNNSNNNNYYLILRKLTYDPWSNAHYKLLKLTKNILKYRIKTWMYMVSVKEPFLTYLH